jgi:hypothetical protein
VCVCGCVLTPSRRCVARLHEKKKRCGGCPGRGTSVRGLDRGDTVTLCLTQAKRNGMSGWSNNSANLIQVVALPRH